MRAADALGAGRGIFERDRIEAELLQLLGQFHRGEFGLRDGARAARLGDRARTIPQPQFTPTELAKQMQKLGLDPAALENAAGRARACGMPDAVSDLADLVESLDAPRAPVHVGRVQQKEAFA